MVQVANDHLYNDLTTLPSQTLKSAYEGHARLFVSVVTNTQKEAYMGGTS